jgi:hypothetical protein
VPVGPISTFLRTLCADAADPLTNPKLMGNYINSLADTELKEWDVLLAQRPERRGDSRSALRSTDETI